MAVLFNHLQKLPKEGKVYWDISCYYDEDIGRMYYRPFQVSVIKVFKARRSKWAIRLENLTGKKAKPVYRVKYHHALHDKVMTEYTDNFLAKYETTIRKSILRYLKFYRGFYKKHRKPEDWHEFERMEKFLNKKLKSLAKRRAADGNQF
jgi:hypothetical protein